MSAPELCVGAVIRRNHEILLIRRGRGVSVGQWSIPGGRVEFGETLVDAVRREVAEETGVDVEVGALIGWVERIDADHHFVIADFHAKARSDTLRAGDDAADARWMRVDALGEVDLVDGLLEFLNQHHLLSP